MIATLISPVVSISKDLLSRKSSLSVGSMPAVCSLCQKPDGALDDLGDVMNATSIREIGGQLVRIVLVSRNRPQWSRIDHRTTAFCRVA